MIELSGESTDDSKSRESDFQPAKKTAPKRKAAGKKPSAVKKPAKTGDKTAKKPAKKDENVKKAKKPAKAVDEGEAKALILKLINEKNRPFSLAQICDMAKGVQKAKVSALLDALEAERKIAQKTFKKTKIFFAEPNAAPAADLAAAAEKLAALTRRQRGLSGVLGAAAKETAALEAGPPDEALAAQIAQLLAANAAKSAKAEGLAEAACAGRRDEPRIDAAALAALRRERERCAALLRARRRTALAMAEAFLGDEAQKSPAELMEELGCVVDECE